MHPCICATATRTGLGDKLCVLGCGVEDIPGLHVDTLITVLTLYSIPWAEHMLARLVREVLRPGGVAAVLRARRKLPDKCAVVAAPLDARVEGVWTSACRFGWGLILTAAQLCFNGCVLNQPTDRYVWDLADVWEPFPREDVAGQMGIWGRRARMTRICGGIKPASWLNECTECCMILLF